MSLTGPGMMPDHYGFGTVFRMRPKPGCEGALRQLVRHWGRAFGPRARGAIATYLIGMPGADEMWGVAVFDSQADYSAVANSPEQDHWYRQLRALLREDPEWHDGYIEGGTPSNG